MVSRFILSAAFFIALTVAAWAQSEPTKEVSAGGPSLSYGIVVDNSGSMRTLLDRIVKAVGTVLEMHRPGDEAFLVTFVDSEKIVIRQEMTSDADELAAAGDNMFIEGGHTALLDAVKLSLDYLVENSRRDEGREYRLILITDGDDRDSRTTIDALLTQLREAKVPVIVLAVSDVPVKTKVVDRIVKESSGRKYQPKKLSEVSAAVEELAAGLRTRP